MTARSRSTLLFAASLLILSLIAFQSKAPQVYFRFDGSQLLITAAMQRDWAIGSWNFTSNPLEGIGGLELPQHNLIDPGFWLTAHSLPSIAPTLAMTFYALELAIAIGWLGVRLGLRLVASGAAIWLGLLLAFPYVYPPLGFEFLWGVPSDATIILADTALILFFLDLGLGALLRDLARVAAMFVISAYLMIQYPNFVLVALVAPAFFSIAAIFTAASLRERAIKLLCIAVLAGILLLMFSRMLLGLFGFSKATFFWYEFYPRPGSWRDLTFFVAEHSHWPAWIVLALALIGTLHAALRGGVRMRPMAWGFLAFVCVELILVLAVNEKWKGPRIAYLDIFAYPFYCVFAAYTLNAALCWISQHINLSRQDYHRAVIIFCALPWLVLLDIWPRPLDRPMVRNLNPYIWPPAETPVIKFLVNAIALHPGSVFRGRVASVAGSTWEPQWVHAPLIAQHDYDVLSLFFSGNDHRLYGLWYFGIPTLVELNQFVSPFFHLVNARLLNAPGTQDLRSYETQSIVNDRIMAMLGTSYLLSDNVLPARNPVAHVQLVKGRDLYVYMIPGANVSGYSVTQTRRATDAQEAIDLLANPSIDLRSVAVLTSPEELPPLTTATASKIVVERGGYRIEASSQGTSLLVLPIEYSHCLRAALTTTSATPPRLFQANLAMAAVLFTSDVKGEIQLRYGPLHSGCRMQDWDDAKALKIGAVREWPPVR